MKAKVLCITAALSGLFVLSAIPAFAAFPASCSNVVLHGNYGFTVNGKITPPGGSAFVAQQGVSLQDFDGNGHFTAKDFIMTNGASAINPGTAVNANGFRVNESGTYTVNSDCTGSMILNQYTKFNTLAASIHIKFVLAQGGKEIREVVSGITAFPPDGPVSGIAIPATILANGTKLGRVARDTDDGDWD